MYRTLDRRSRVRLMIQRATVFHLVSALHTSRRSELITAISTRTKAKISNSSYFTSSAILQDKKHQKTKSWYDICMLLVLVE